MSGRPCLKIFSDLELLLSTLQYAEVFASPETPPLSADGVLAGARCTFQFVRQTTSTIHNNFDCLMKFLIYFGE